MIKIKKRKKEEHVYETCMKLVMYPFMYEILEGSRWINKRSYIDIEPVWNNFGGLEVFLCHFWFKVHITHKPKQSFLTLKYG